MKIFVLVLFFRQIVPILPNYEICSIYSIILYMLLFQLCHLMISIYVHVPVMFIYVVAISDDSTRKLARSMAKLFEII